MTAYGLAHLRQPGALAPQVFEYMERIQPTLDPYSGRFLVHGGAVEVLEGTWPGSLVLLEFPGLDEARAWYASPAYQEILRLRTDYLVSDVILVPGVGADHDSAKLAAQFRAAIGAA